ncbi:hypothetical protein Nepgr_024174 [Nepenthes gracilis]|uniref:Uncharacterized protein n=1 Tax=Nepenthes gracilis TaxID=150966 RepID=A0AAD3T471_NEPGR|nr:hypothetical protein Nepgr_024174 [Nepenthes gracilis]
MSLLPSHYRYLFATTTSIMPLPFHRSHRRAASMPEPPSSYSYLTIPPPPSPTTTSSTLQTSHHHQPIAPPSHNDPNLFTNVMSLTSLRQPLLMSHDC